MLYLPPSKTPPTEEEIEKFNQLYQKMHARLAPGTEEEVSLCNEVVVGLWHSRWNEQHEFAAKKRLKQLRQQVAEPDSIEQAAREMAFHAYHARHQKNFAWRRRGKYFALKTAREEQEQQLLAA